MEYDYIVDEILTDEADDTATAYRPPAFPLPEWANEEDPMLFALIPDMLACGFDFGVYDRAGVKTPVRFIEWLGGQMPWSKP